jgi:hypothetical protein
MSLSLPFLAGYVSACVVDVIRRAWRRRVLRAVIARLESFAPGGPVPGPFDRFPYSADPPETAVPLNGRVIPILRPHPSELED